MSTHNIRFYGEITETIPELPSNATLICSTDNHTDYKAAPVAEWLRQLICSALNRSSSHCCGLELSSGHM